MDLLKRLGIFAVLASVLTVPLAAKHSLASPSQGDDAHVAEARAGAAVATIALLGLVIYLAPGEMPEE